MPDAELNDQIEFVAIESVRPHPQNPRQGDVGLVAISIAENGWFGACLVQRTDDGDTMVAGEHRWRGLRALQDGGYTQPDGTHVTYDDLRLRVPLPPLGTVPVIARPWTDAEALRVLLVDNRTADAATYDDAALAALLTTLAEQDALLGTGFDGDDLDALLRTLAPPDAPPEFPDAEALAANTEHRCPACGYVWSGQSNPAAAPESIAD